MVVVVPTEPDSGKMKRSQSWTGTVDIGYALSEDETSKPGSWSSLMLPAVYGALAGLATAVLVYYGAARHLARAASQPASSASSVRVVHLRRLSHRRHCPLPALSIIDF